ncbi:MAG: NAD(+) synthase [Oscillospiraceae bacterium]|nr:NAD(+) synthase [Oscillospiraceae bacterium]
MHNIIRLTAAINKVSCADPADCLKESKSLLFERTIGDFDIMIFPQLSLCSPSCGDLFASTVLTQQCSAALDQLRAASLGREGYVIAGFVMEDCGKPVSAMAVLHKGQLLGILPTCDNPGTLATNVYSDYILPPSTVFSCGGLRFSVVSCALSCLATRVAEAARTGCELILVPSYSPAFAGQEGEVLSLIAGLSRSLGVAIAVVNGGVGDTSSPYVYRGFVSVFECGSELAYMQAGSESVSCTADIDVDVIRARKQEKNCPTPFHGIPAGKSKPGLFRPIERIPFLPSLGREAYLTDLFSLQVRSLAARMKNTGTTKLVLGVSGGLDSTAALLVCVKAVDNLGLGREGIIGVTLPGLGTSEHTHYNALRLMENLGVTMREVSIRRAVEQHFEDIDHSGEQDFVYENAQARERTQVLFDIANSASAIVVGTGDLSEAALGFCTYGGDHLAGYNVNICVSKTVLRELTRHICETGLVENVQYVVQSILATPISPELLPPQDGLITQKTEDILGPYELLDFFIYHFVGNKMRPSKIFFYACKAFSELGDDFIREKLVMFIKRFCGSQFKRSCAPDSASITRVNLNGINFQMPSDLNPAFLLRDL